MYLLLHARYLCIGFEGVWGDILTKSRDVLHYSLFFVLAIGPCSCFITQAFSLTLLFWEPRPPVNLWNVWTSKVTDTSLIALSMRISSFTSSVFVSAPGLVRGGRMRTSTISLSLRADLKWKELGDLMLLP